MVFFHYVLINLVFTGIELKNNMFHSELNFDTDLFEIY